MLYSKKNGDEITGLGKRVKVKPVKQRNVTREVIHFILEKCLNLICLNCRLIM